MELVRPSELYLPGYIDALNRGWSPDNLRGEAAIREEREAIDADAGAFLSSQEDPEAMAGPVTLPDGSAVPRLPGFHRWLWDGAFCGQICIRWQPGTSALPPHCPGHIGYAVVPWKQRRGYATLALRLLLPEARALGLEFVELTTSTGNLASRRVIEANGGVLVERFTSVPQLGARDSLRFRIFLQPRPGS
jgi:predicted acetyltransferase